MRYKGYDEQIGNCRYQAPVLSEELVDSHVTGCHLTLSVKQAKLHDGTQ